MHYSPCVTHTKYLYTNKPVTLGGQTEPSPKNDSRCVTHTDHSESNPMRDSVWLTPATCIIISIPVTLSGHSPNPVPCTTYSVRLTPTTYTPVYQSHLVDSLNPVPRTTHSVTHTNSVYTPERDSRAGLVRLDTTTQWIHDDQKLHRVPHTHTRRLPLTLFYTTHTNCLPYTRLRSGNKEGVTT